MATALDVLAPLRESLLPVPAPQLGVCKICHNGIEPKYSQCPSCNKGSDALGVLDPIIPIALSIHGELLHHTLRKYKDDANDEIKRRLSRRLAALLTVFLYYHSKCLGDWDILVPVPSAGRTALMPVLNMTPYQVKVETLLHSASSTSPGARITNPARFSIDRDVQGDRILLLDDTFTTGASLFSARATLTSAGAKVVQAVVLGRHIRPDIWPPASELLSWLGGRPWIPERCCICAGEYRTVPTLF